MGKKNLIKSTSKKKKSASKKKDEDKTKKSAGPKGTKKSAPKKKAASAKKAAAKKADTGKKAAPKKAASAKNASLKELLFKQFEKEAPAELVKIEPEKGEYAAPPLISTTDGKEKKRLKSLLFRKVDLTTPVKKRETVSEPEVPAAVEKEKEVEKPSVIKEKEQAKEPPDMKEILSRKFFEAPPAESLFAPEAGEETPASAPPLISTSDREEAEWLKKLLFRKIDLTTPVEKREPEPEPEAPVAVEKEEMTEEPAEEPAAEEEAAKEPPDMKEILSRKFFEAPPAESLFAPEAGEETLASAPPLISTSDREEAEWLKKLLFRKIDLTTPVEKREPEPEPEASVEATKEEKVEEPAVEFETREKEPEAVAPDKVEPEKAPEVGPEMDEAPEESPKVTVSYDEPPPTDTEVSDPMEKMIKYAAAGFILILLLIIGYSFDNRANYYIQPDDDGIEILRGNFAPLGKVVIAELEGVPAPENIKEVYEAEEVLPMAFNYYVNRADTLMDTNGLPDLQKIQANLDKSLSFATTKEQNDLVYSRMNSLEYLVLQYKANVAAQRGTPEGVAAAIGILQEALRMDLNESDKAVIQNRIDYLQNYREQLTAQETEAEVGGETEAAEAQAVGEQAIEEEEAADNEAVGEEEAAEDEAEEHDDED